MLVERRPRPLDLVRPPWNVGVHDLADVGTDRRLALPDDTPTHAAFGEVPLAVAHGPAAHAVAELAEHGHEGAPPTTTLLHLRVDGGGVLGGAAIIGNGGAGTQGEQAIQGEVGSLHEQDLFQTPMLCGITGNRV